MTRPRGTGCVYHRVGTTVWWIKYSRNGKPFSESSRTTDKRKAEKILKQRLAEIQTGTFIGPETERVRLQELADDFLALARQGAISDAFFSRDIVPSWGGHLDFFAQTLDGFVGNNPTHASEAPPAGPGPPKALAERACFP